MAMRSSNGRFVAFASDAWDLIEDDTLGNADIFLRRSEDIFVRDVVTGTTTRVNVDSAEDQATGASSSGPSISADGSLIAFVSDANDLVLNDGNASEAAFVRDRTLDETLRVSVNSSGAERSGASEDPVISADRRFVVFGSKAKLAANDTADAF